MLRGVVRHACHCQLCPIVVQHDVLVEQDPCAQPPQLVDPRVDAGIVLVVARDDVGPMP